MKLCELKDIYNPRIPIWNFICKNASNFITLSIKESIDDQVWDSVYGSVSKAVLDTLVIHSERFIRRRRDETL
jgi:hypothetical protein